MNHVNQHMEDKQCKQDKILSLQTADLCKWADMQLVMGVVRSQACENQNPGCKEAKSETDPFCLR